MRVVVLGAGGIIGQHMLLDPPPGVDAVFTRRYADRCTVALDAEDRYAVERALDQWRPDAVVNLVGEGAVDQVERSPARYLVRHVELPEWLARWCEQHDRHYVHVSSQAVFDGTEPPYGSGSPLRSVNRYGTQKILAEQVVRTGRGWTIARVTFVLGIRPWPGQGRQNPLEAMLSTDAPQVADRFFSPSFARDVAVDLWVLALGVPLEAAVHVGIPMRVSRAELATRARRLAGLEIETKAVSHDDFPGLAARPLDTTYAIGTRPPGRFDERLAEAIDDWRGVTAPARILASYFGLTEHQARGELQQGFWHFHRLVAEDFRRVTGRDRTPEMLLAWYRQTTAYIWELSAYHQDPGFNYAGTCQGIVGHLRHHGLPTVLCLGDGIGDLTIACAQAGLDPVYHDLRDSKTVDFAWFKFWAQLRQNPVICLTDDWTPVLGTERYDAVVALDFLEHVPNVPEWAAAIWQALRPGGQFLAQNAFGIGDEDHEGSIPMHLVINNKYVTEWPLLLTRLGFMLEPSGWWRKPGGDLELRAYE